MVQPGEHQTLVSAPPDCSTEERGQWPTVCKVVLALQGVCLVGPKQCLYGPHKAKPSLLGMWIKHTIMTTLGCDYAQLGVTATSYAAIHTS